MSEPAIDELIDGKYKVVRHIGQGAWATVYEALNVRIQRRVAIKILHPDSTGRADMQQRFLREAEAATRIDSPFVIGVFDMGTLPDGRSYLVMELLDGEDLGKRLARGRLLDTEQAAQFGVHALTGLSEAHANGVFHRDIKPDNLFIAKAKNGDEVLKIVDFGISKLGPRHTAESLSITKTDVVLGSPVYMSPEQCRGTKHMDARSDLYSIGVVLFEALTGKVPHIGDTFNELMFKIALEDAPDIATVQPDIDPGLAEILNKALQREPKKRYQTADDFADALTEWLEQRGAAGRSSNRSKVKIRTEPVSEETRSRLPRLSDSSTEPLSASTERAPRNEALTATVRVKKRTLLGAGVLALLALAFGLWYVRPRAPQPTAAPEPHPVLTAPGPATTLTATAEPAAEPAASVAIVPAVTHAPAPLPPPPVIAAPKKPPVVATTASAPAAAAPAPPAPAASKTTIEGRTIQTSF